MPKSNSTEKEDTYLLITDRCTDKPLTDDKDERLSFNDLMPSFSEYIGSFKSRLIIGIYGEWGSGKTSFVNIYLDKLKKEGKEPIKIVFDAWKFKDDKNLWKSFFLNILNELTKKDSNKKAILSRKKYDYFSNKLCYSEDKIGFEFNNKIKWILVFISSFLFAYFLNNYLQIPILTILTLLTPIVAFFISLIQIRRSRGPIDSFFEFDEELKKLEVELKDKIDKDFPVVVIVENLDRVEPKYAIELLESIKTLFEFEGFMYFILCDPTILEKQIQEMYKTETLTAEIYLQKIITVPFFLPPIDISDLEEFIQSLLKNNKFNENLIKYLKISGIKNPRKIKKMLLEMEMAYRFMQSLDIEIKVPFILKLIILRYEYPLIFQLIRMYAENKEISRIRVSLELLTTDAESWEGFTYLTNTILEKILNFTPKDEGLIDKNEYPENIKESLKEISSGFHFIMQTKDRVYDISDLSELSPYLLSAAVTGDTHLEKIKPRLLPIHKFYTKIVEPPPTIIEDYENQPQIRGLTKNNTLTWYNKGIVLFDQREFSKAIECFDKALEINPKFAYAWYNKGLALKKLGRNIDAKECFDKILEIDSNFAFKWVNEGLLLFEQDQLSKAIECFDKALEIDPKFAYAWHNKGLVLFDQREFSKAIECFDKALEIDPKFAYAWYNKGLLLFEQDQLSKAIECFDKALEIDPKFAYAWYNKGTVLYNKGEFSKAIECFDKALKINPVFAYAWHNKGLVLFDQREFSKAIECYDTALEIDPKFAYAWYNKGTALYNKGEFSKAIECFDKALEIDSKFALAWYNKGLVLFDQGEYTEAQECFDKAKELGLSLD